MVPNSLARMCNVKAINGHVACEAMTNWHGVAAAVAAEELQPIATTPFSEGSRGTISEDAPALAPASLACTSGQRQYKMCKYRGCLVWNGLK